MRADMSQQYVKDSTGEAPTTMFFSYADPTVGDQCSRTLTYEAGARWDDLLVDFVSFLSGIYGYDISKKIQIEGNFWEKFEEGREFY